MALSMLQADGLVKCYGDFCAVDHLSFEVHEAEIFGLLGPNGAGKTTTIRCLMDIFKPDEGTLRVLGQPPGRARERVGYLPEERGLYPKLRVVQLLVYLAQLKGMEREAARRSALDWLERLGLSEWGDHRLRELSRGMQQKIQFAACVVHRPRLLILDEPFQGLDPVNVDLLKAQMRQLQEEGVALVLSAHQMNLVEELCDRILLIHQGRAMLYGPLDKIKQRYAPNAVRLRTAAELGDLPGVTHIERRGSEYTLTLNDIEPQALLRELIARDVPLQSYEVGTAPLAEIFVRVVQGGARA